MNRKRTKSQRGIKIPIAVVIIVSALPAVMTALFYALRSNAGLMDRVSIKISSPVRGFMGMLSSIYPFSLMEVLCAAAFVWLLYYIIKTIVVMSRRQRKLNILARRLMTVIVLALYVWSLSCWLWNSGYFAPGFAEKNGLISGGVSASDLAKASRLFAGKANELAPQVKRDKDGRFIEDRRDYLPESAEVYSNIAKQYPGLAGKLYPPKPMLFSWLMSRTGYTGVYFALTGESNINVNAPGALLPATIAHELAHQNGIYAEDEANFIGIAACVSSERVIYEYSGYLSGLIYLQNALYNADRDAWAEINGSLASEVLQDWRENSEYWQAQKTVHTGNGFIDRMLTSVIRKLSDSVDTVYDGYLKSNNQALGLKSYGACVDLLVEYFVVRQ